MSHELAALQLQPLPEGLQPPQRHLRLYANASGSMSGESAYYAPPQELVPTFVAKHKVAVAQNIFKDSAKKLRVLRFDARPTYGKHCGRSGSL